jgi:serine/threonine protein kinase
MSSHRDGTRGWETLRQIVPIQKIQDVLGYAIQIGEALQEAHNNGIIHRDVKTANIMVNTKNQIKVMDFGLAKLKGSVKLTKTTSTVGTLAYMAPEQIRGDKVDARSDIYSLGIILLRKERQEDFGLTLQNAKAAIRDSLILCVIFFPPFLFFFGQYQHMFFHAKFAPAMPQDLLLWSMFQLLLVALPEEVLYRGYFQTMLNRVYGRRYRFLGASWGPGLIVSSAMFALGHVLFTLNPLRANVFFPGLVFGWLRERASANGKGGLLGPILFHAVCNIFVKILEASFVSP